MLRNKIFYIHYAGLTCRVIAPVEWSKYFKKLYENSNILRYSEKVNVKNADANLLIKIVKSGNVFIRFQPGKIFTEYTVTASDTPLFLYPTAHQFVSRIFNIIFHLAGGVVLHSSSILIGNKALLFVGESGRGKSTIVNLINSSYPKYKILSDNSVFVKKSDSDFVIYPSPYLEANRLNSLQTEFSVEPPYTIGAVFFPYHAKYNKIKSLSFENKISLIRNNSHIPYRPEILFKKSQIVHFGRLLFDFVDSVGMFKLEFVNNSSFIRKVIKYANKQGI